MFNKNNKAKTLIVTGAAGFIGYHVCKQFLDAGWCVVGVDNLSPYYDVNLKKYRVRKLTENVNYISEIASIDAPGYLTSLFEKMQPSLVVHLAAQAGVRYSIENPSSYLYSNIVGTFELLEACRKYPVEHALLASTSSVYGSNDVMPFLETEKTDHQMSFYAATKKSTEAIAHSYSHLFGIPITMFRFFTVYGPLGRPDMALFKFTESIINNDEIEVFNGGDMKRDFTYIDDLVLAIQLLSRIVPNVEARNKYPSDSLSPIAPFRIVNIGNAKAIKLADFISAIEDAIGIKAKINYLPMQPGDVPSTLASNKLLFELTNYVPNTDIKYGVKKFVNWYREYFEF